MDRLCVRKPKSCPGWSILALVLCVCVACSSGPAHPTTASSPSFPPSSSSQLTPSSSQVSLLPGEQTWKQGVSSLLFGTNDTTEWSPQNFETQSDIQQALRAAGFTLVRSFFQDGASDTETEQRIQAIERSGAHCLGVITNIFNLSYDEHLIQYLGKRCLLYEFGNEPDYNNISVTSYLKQWNALIPVLRQRNPEAKFIGPVVSDPTSSFLPDFLRGVKNSGVLPDAISFHWYPCYQNSESDCLGMASTAGQQVVDVRQLVISTLGKDLPVGITEWNYDPGNPPPSYGDNATFITTFSNTALQSMIQAKLVFACQFDAASYAGYGHLDLFDLQNNDAPKPQYYAIKALIARYRPT